jgi:methyl-accepting chemotaxis protein
MNSEQETLPNLQTVLDAVNNLQRETVKQFAELRQEISELRQETNEKFENMRLEMMSFDARIDRLQAMSHESLNLAYNVRADVKILREEVSAWSKEVRAIQQKNFV